MRPLTSVAVIALAVVGAACGLDSRVLYVDGAADGSDGSSAPPNSGMDARLDVGPDRDEVQTDAGPPDDGPSQLAAPPHLLAPASTGLVTSRRPTLRWAPAAGAQGYQVDLCDDPACANVREVIKTATTSAQPSAALPPHRATFWRVRALSGGAADDASSSPIWELFVGWRDAGRDASWLGPPDFNRDGRSDVAIGGYGATTYLMMNLPPGGLPTKPSQTVFGGEDFGAATAYAGDVDGDGFGDLIVGAFGAGSASILYGNATGVRAVPTVLSSARMNFGTTVAGLGDVNGDGFADVAVGDDSLSYLYLGGPEGISLTASGSPFNGSVIGGAGDVNGDGFADVIVCGSSSAAATIYLGGAAGLSPSTVLTPPSDAQAFDGCIGAGDVNGDGYADVILSTSSTASAYVYYGGAAGVRADGATSLAGADGSGFGVTTSIASAGDVNGDGFADVIVGGFNGNVVRVFHGGSSGVSTTAGTVFDQLPPGEYAKSVASAGDANGDGYADVVFAPSQCSGFDVYVYPGSSGGITKATPLRDWTDPDDAGCFGVIAR